MVFSVSTIAPDFPFLKLQLAYCCVKQLDQFVWQKPCNDGECGCAAFECSFAMVVCSFSQG